MARCSFQRSGYAAAPVCGVVLLGVLAGATGVTAGVQQPPPNSTFVSMGFDDPHQPVYATVAFATHGANAVKVVFRTRVPRAAFRHLLITRVTCQDMWLNGMSLSRDVLYRLGPIPSNRRDVRGLPLSVPYWSTVLKGVSLTKLKQRAMSVVSLDYVDNACGDFPKP